MLKHNGLLHHVRLVKNLNSAAKNVSPLKNQMNQPEDPTNLGSPLVNIPLQTGDEL
jgi:hypothetical protein